ncbi:hypothetical protein F5890DRAFT_407144 [Lentinula detonsa]|uniref:Uncharacterized protein n=1 Tax=Lentinula detonsa TaxID=2804962 RepID=A0AA38UR27_9AGAR|nr:hypothetical protein F5890DRAFT_407144 [Lentinula detonsa]
MIPLHPPDKDRKKNTAQSATRTRDQMSESESSNSTSSCFRRLLRVRVTLVFVDSVEFISLNLALASDAAFSFPSGLLCFVIFSVPFVDASPDVLDRVVARLVRAVLPRSFGKGEGECCLRDSSSFSSPSSSSSSSPTAPPSGSSSSSRSRSASSSSTTFSSSSETFPDQAAATALDPLPRFGVTFGFDFAGGEPSRSGPCACSTSIRFDRLLAPALFFRVGLGGSV